MLPTPPPPSPTPVPAIIERVRVTTGSPEIVHRLTLPASLLDERTIRLSPSATSDDMLRGLPGVDRTRSNSAFTNYGQTRVSFGGAGSDRGLVIVDGIPAQDGFGGQIDWSAYPSWDLQRVELLRGPGSALYGSGAIGGVLALHTDESVPTAARELEIAAGTNDAFDTHARAGFVEGKLAATAAYGTSRLSYRDLPPSYSTPIDAAADATQTLVALGARYAPSNASYVEYGARGAFDVQNQGRSNYDFWRRMDEQRVAAHVGAFDATFFERHGHVTNRADVSASPGSLLYTQEVPTHEDGASLAYTHVGANATLQARVTSRRVDGESAQYDAAGACTAFGSGTQQLLDASLQEMLQWRGGEVVAGIAASSVSLIDASIVSKTTTESAVPATYRVLSPRLALRLDLNPSVALRASVGSGFRAPFLNELVRGYTIGRVQYLPNTALLPERSGSYSAGVDIARGANELSFDLTHTDVANAIGFTTIDATHQQRQNVGHAQTDGATLVVRRVLPQATLSVWATDQYARVTSGASGVLGKELAYVPQTAAGMTIATQRGRFAYEVGASYSGVTFADDRNAQALTAVTTLDARVEYRVQPTMTIFAQLRNATGARYLSSIDRYGPPATLQAGLRIASP